MALEPSINFKVSAENRPQLKFMHLNQRDRWSQHQTKLKGWDEGTWSGSSSQTQCAGWYKLVSRSYTSRFTEVTCCCYTFLIIHGATRGHQLWAPEIFRLHARAMTANHSPPWFLPHRRWAGVGVSLGSAVACSGICGTCSLATKGQHLPG